MAGSYKREQPAPIHLRIYPQCGICVQFLEKSVSIQVVYRQAPKIFVCSPSFLLRQEEEFRLSTARLVICNKTECKVCEAAEDAVPVHKGCYALVKKQCANHDIDAINIRIWAMAAFRKPWNNSQPLFLPHLMNDDVSLIGNVATELGLPPKLLDVPVEIVEAIKDYSKHSLFWRFVTARTVATYISKMIDQPLELQTIPLREIADWRRGAAVTRASPRFLPPFITITIDSDGIRDISRQNNPSDHSGGRSTNVAYIILSHDDDILSELDVHILYGRCRLVVPPEMEPPRIWETSAPPAWSACNMSMNDRLFARKWPRLAVANLEGITGITFFLILGNVAGIHIHYPGETSALETFKKLGDSVRRYCVWNYVPISKDDRITSIGVNRGPARRFNMLIQTEKSGDIVVGAYNEAFKDNCFVQTAPLMLVYQQLKWWDFTKGLGFVGTYSAAEQARRMEEADFPVNKYEDCPLSLHSSVSSIFFSWAPLENVASAVIFKNEKNGVTRGIVLNYLNGGSRALGYVRVGVDLAEEVVLPTGICYKIAHRWNPFLVVNDNDEDGQSNLGLGRRATIHSVRVQFQTEPEHSHPDDERWNCKPMANIFKFWSLVGNSFCIVRDGTETTPIDYSTMEH